MGCRGGSKGCAMKARGDLLIDAKSKQSPPISSKHTVPHTTTHTPAGSSDMWTQTWEEEEGHVRRRTEATVILRRAHLHSRSPLLLLGQFCRKPHSPGNGEEQ